MTTTKSHYDEFLGPMYVWMAGGIDAALQRGHSELVDLGITSSEDGLAVDLGAGFGMHTLPLTRLGFRVIAIDSCKGLLDTMLARKGAATVDAVHDDLLSFRDHLPESPGLILCMGDTLPHLVDYREVEELVSNIAAALAVGGLFAATFRDYTRELKGRDRFIPVRSEATRIHTCFLEYTASHVHVHDLVNEREKTGWNLRVSTYPKLRIAPTWFADLLRANGLTVEAGPGPSRMVRFTARREQQAPDAALGNGR